MNPVARRFARAATTYERGASLHRHVAARLLSLTPDPDRLVRGRLLEIGCGTGVLSDLIRQRYPGASLSLLDAAATMVAGVRERWGAMPGVRYIVADVREFREPCSFEWIFSSSALHWAEPLEETFLRLRENLAPGGGCSLALMVDGTLAELHTLRRQIAPAKTPPGRLASGGEVLAAARWAGFDIVVSEEESIRARYHAADDFLRTLHAQGLTGGAVSRAVAPMGRTELARLCEAYDREFAGEDGGVYATFQVLYLNAVG